MKNLRDTFDKMDRIELSLVLDQIARRIKEIQHGQESIFWADVVQKVSRYISCDLILNNEEQEILTSNKEQQGNPYSKAIIRFKRRTGASLCESRDVVERWMLINFSALNEQAARQYLQRHSKKEVDK